MPRRKVNPTKEIAKVIAKLGKASFGDILKETGLAEPTIARHLKIMEAKGLILSERSEEDKRKFIYELNPEELIFATQEEVLKHIEQELGRELTEEEREALEDILINHIRLAMIELLKKDHLKGEIDEIINLLDSVVLLHCVKKSALGSLISLVAPDMEGEDYAELSKDLFPKHSFLPPLYGAMDKLPDRFVEDWTAREKFKASSAGVIWEFIKNIEKAKLPSES